MKNTVVRILSVLIVLLLVAACSSAPPAAAPAEAPAASSDTAASDAGSSDAAATEAPAQEAAPAGEASARGFYEAPMLTELVASGDLPPVDERLPEEPLVVTPRNEVGKYGGEQRGAGFGPSTGQLDTEAFRMQSLLFIEPDLVTLSPNILAGYERSDDFTTWTLHLRAGMKWSDGAPFTADDFVYWYENMLLNPDLTPAPSIVYRSGETVMDLEKVDDATIVITFAEPNPNFDLTLSKSYWNDRMFAPAHYLSQYNINTNPDANELASSEGFENWILAHQFHDEFGQAQQDTNAPDITPWVLSSIDELGNKYFERNAYYWAVDTAGNQLPYIDRQVSILVQDAQVRILKFISQELDAAGENPLPVSEYPFYVENEEQGNYKVFLFDNTRGNDVGFSINQTIADEGLREIFTDLRFRQALSLGIDRNEINNILYFGRAVVRQATIPDSVSFYDESMGEHFAAFDADAANALLDEMGLTRGSDGVRTRADGSPLEITLECWEEFCPHSEQVAEMWTGNLGIKTTMSQIERTLWLERNQANEQQIYAHPYDSIAEPALRANNCARIRPLTVDSYAPLWRAWYNSGGAEGEEPSAENQAIMALCDEFAVSVPNSEEYMQIGRDMAMQYTEQLYTLGVSIAPRVIIISNRLGNTPTEGVFAGDYMFWVPYRGDQWYVK